MRYLSLLFFGAFSAQATVYKCDTNGVVEFSQFPCADNAEALDMRPVGTALSGTPGEFRQQVDAVKRRSRFVEFQIAKLEQERTQAVDELKSEQYKLRRSFPRAEELTAIAQKIERTEQRYAERISTERATLRGLQAQVVTLERQYAQTSN
ncbi:hypothetical protein WG68_11770 [Arsukibacterium ikkense]|uniref:DUF4124 domain-containing protein n=1 Tax=Arsukibacterium ikkense TaxID=336831 RepID=A0A0M2V2P9_9GAMM|nr:DUF4124 domain-containing protein [Arsukibacterium ikkense]KKO45107.1 hypothetical protein WG68_11770 [Arsukibacterium ikkense]